MTTKIGIIGGSGLEDPNILQNAQDKIVNNRYGSASLKVGTIENVPVVLLSRHGKKHTIPPSQVNYRANILALHDEACTHILATSAVGSLKEEIGRGDLIILDQFIDFTKHRINTFFESFTEHNPIHTSMAEAFDTQLRSLFAQKCQELNLKYHPNGTVVTIEGPRFSSRAESKMFRLWGADVVNMSIASEVILAHELAIPYAAIAMSTDYDCWKEDEHPVSWDEISKVFADNAQNVLDLLIKIIPNIK